MRIPKVKRDGMTWKIHVLTWKIESRWCRLELSTVLKDNNDGLLWMHSLSLVYCCFCCPYLIHFAMLSWEIAVLLYISYTCWVLKLIFCIQERHLGILWFVFQGYGTRELTFSILKSTFQVKKQYFAVIATYISSAETTFVVESWNSCYILKLHLPFKYEDYIWCISMQCLMHFVSVLDNHPLFEKLRLCFERAKSEKSGCEASVYFVCHFKMICDIPRWGLSTHKFKTLELMEATADAIKGLWYFRMSIATDIISGYQAKIWEVFLEEIFIIWLFHQCCDFHYSSVDDDDENVRFSWWKILPKALR